MALSLLLNKIVLKMEDYKKQLSEVKAVEFRGAKLNVKFPNVGEMIDIENLKPRIPAAVTVLCWPAA